MDQKQETNIKKPYKGWIDDNRLAKIAKRIHLDHLQNIRAKIEYHHRRKTLNKI